MGTWTSFYVEANFEDVIAASAEWLRRSGKKVTETRGAYPQNVRFRLTGSEPRRLIAGTLSSTWSEVHVDGFYSPNPAAQFVSERLKTRVVNTIAQTTSDCYELTALDSGKQIRRLQFEEFEWVAQEGVPLPGEPVPLATRNEEDDELEAFHHKEMRVYCEKVFGFDYWKPPQGREWCDIATRGGLFGWLGR